MDRIDKPLGDIVSESRKKAVPKKGGVKGDKKGGKGKLAPKKTVKTVAKKTKAAVINKPIIQRGGVNRFEHGGASQIFNRIGTVNTQTSGTSITFENLSRDINKNDLRQLCATIGSVTEVKFSDKTTAEVWYERRSHAVSAVKKFSDLTLDGNPLSVYLTHEGPPSQQSKNVRLGLFGTANGAASVGRGRSTTFQVNLGGSSDRRSIKKPVPKKKPFKPAKKISEGDLNDQLDSYKSGEKPTAKGKGGRRKKATPEEVESDFDKYLASR